MSERGSFIFVGYRALGFATNDIPHGIFYSQKHKENYIVTCVGKSFHIYNSSKLGIVVVGNVHNEAISCLASDALHVFTAHGKSVQSFFRGRHVDHKYEGHDYPVHLLLPFANHLISVDTESTVKIWDIKSEELFAEQNFSNATFQIVALLHPNTYVNKILFASKQGSMQLWNIRTSKLVYMFAGWGKAITALEQAPAVDVVAVGLCDGQVMLHNLRQDDTLMTFSQDWGPVTCIAFRTDGEPIMATGSPAGHIALWNLEKRRLQSQIRDAHNGAISGMTCLPSEPLLVTTSSDNALKVWVFDQPDGGGRLLRERSGHSAPPTRVRFHGNNGQTVLSAGQDSTLRSFSTVHDSYNRSLGRASYHKAESKRVGLKNDKYMMPPITDFASEASHQSDWDSVVACHRSEKIVTTWNYNRFTMGDHKLLHDRFEKERQFHSVTATVVTITSCGNFAVIGYSSGHVDVFNMQSGLHRGSYGASKAHEGAIRGVAVDGLNQVTVTGAADSCLKFWHFKQKTLLGSLKMSSFISRLTLHRDSSMLAVALDDLTVAVVDVDTRTIVRSFQGHKASVTDLAFSPDARWLISSSMDCTVKTWDLPTGRLVDCFLVDQPVTSLALSPTGDFLVSTHVDDLGVYLWYNSTLYSNVTLKPLPADYEPVLVDLPGTSHVSAAVHGSEVDSTNKADEDEFLLSTFKSPEQISDELVTLSLLPHSRWHSLLHLDVIKQRNKPKQPPKVPKLAPFFLPTVAGLTPKLASADENADKEKTEARVHVVPQQSLSPFARLLTQADADGSYEAVMDRLKEMGPSSIDLELQSLGPEWGGSMDLVRSFMVFLQHAFKTNKNFELAQAYLGLLLKQHMDLIVQEPVLTEEAQAVQSSQEEAWARLETLINQNACLVNYLRSATL